MDATRRPSGASAGAWTPAHVALVQKWCDYSRIRAIMHQRTGSLYEWGHYTIGPLAVVVGSVSAITQFANLGSTESDTTNCTATTDPSFAVAVVVLTVLSSVLSGLQTFFRFDKTSTQHRTTANKYECLQHDLEQQLALDASDRTPPLEFIQSTKQQLNDLSASNLSIPTCLLNRYLRDVDHVLDATPAMEPRRLRIVVTPATRGPDEVPPPHALDPVEPEAEEEKDLSSDYQDEFADAVRKQLRQRQDKIEAYQLSRLETATAP